LRNVGQGRIILAAPKVPAPDNFVFWKYYHPATGGSHWKLLGMAYITFLEDSFSAWKKRFKKRSESGP
jgi:hypothetical protein